MNNIRKNISLKIILMIVFFSLFLFFELKLIEFVILFDTNSDNMEMAKLVVARLSSTILFSIAMSSVAVTLATNRRIKAMGDKWLRDTTVKESLSTYLLTLFDHLVTFYYLARIRIITDTVLVLALCYKLIIYLTFQKFIIFFIVAVIVLFSLILIYFFLSKISAMTTQTEKNLVECAEILNQRGVAGWKEKNLDYLMEVFVQYSLKLSQLYTFRLSVGQLIRTLLEFFVFALVASGIIIGGTLLVPGEAASSDTVATILIISRIGPLVFSIITMASTLGLGHFARKTYFS